MIEARFKYFNISKCGFYPRRNGGNLLPFGNISETLGNLYSWAKDGRTLVNTATYSVQDHDELFRTFFCDLQTDSITGDSVLILWNETANENGKLYGMPPLSVPGDTSMLTTEFENEAIPGMPSYFWFVPSKGIIASVTFGHSIPGRSNLERYLCGYLTNYSPYRVFDNAEIKGYSIDGTDNGNCHRYLPQFKLTSRKNTEVLRDLLSNRERITRMIKRENFIYRTEDDRGFIEKLFSGLLSNTPQYSGERKITHEFQFQPTAEQLREIVSNFYAQEGEDPNITSAGFIYNDGKQVMLTGLSLSAKLDLSVGRLDNEIISAQQLLAAISAQRERALSLAELREFEEESVTHESSEDLSLEVE